MDYDSRSVRSGNYHTLTLVTPIVHDGKEPSDYNSLFNKPSINGVELTGGEHTLEELGVQPAGEYASEPLTPTEVDELIDSLE